MEAVKTKLQTMKSKLHEAESQANAAQEELDEYERKKKELEIEVKFFFFIIFTVLTVLTLNAKSLTTVNDLGIDFYLLLLAYFGHYPIKIFGIYKVAHSSGIKSKYNSDIVCFFLSKKGF